MRRVRGHDLEAGDDEDVKPLVRNAPGRSYSPPVYPQPAPKRPILLYLIILCLCGTLIYSHGQVKSKENELRNLENKFRSTLSTTEAAHEQKLKAAVAEAELLKAQELSAKADSDYQQLKKDHDEAQNSLALEIVRRFWVV
jgi:hypothetical protein